MPTEQRTLTSGAKKPVSSFLAWGVGGHRDVSLAREGKNSQHLGRRLDVQRQ
jgi:hypothetical protein